jgi:hypothetical protein
VNTGFSCDSPRHVLSCRAGVLLLSIFCFLISMQSARGDDDCRFDSHGNPVSRSGKCGQQGGSCAAVTTNGESVAVCQCSDPTFRAMWTASTPIMPGTSVQVFRATGEWTISELGSDAVVTTTPVGNMMVRFEPDPFGTTNRLAVIETITLTFPDLSGSTGDVGLLSSDDPFIARINPSGDLELVNGASFFIIDPASGATTGALGNFVTLSSGAFTAKSLITGTLDFETGAWNWSGECAVCSATPEPSTTTLFGVCLLLLGLNLAKAKIWQSLRGVSQWRHTASTPHLSV